MQPLFENPHFGTLETYHRNHKTNRLYSSLNTSTFERNYQFPRTEEPMGATTYYFWLL